MAAVAASPASPPARPAPAPRVRWRSAVAAGVVVTLVRPATWVVALAGFLAGGGAIILAWPIVVLPTLASVQDLLAGPLSTLAFGNPSPELVRAAVIAAAATACLLVAGLAVGAWSERRGIALVLEGAADEGYTARYPDLDGAPGIGRVAVVRALSLVPPLIAGALAWSAVYDATYQELILPSDLAAPLPLRVIARIPAVIAALVGVWLVADAAAAVGVRRLVLERRSIGAAWALGWADLARRPLRILSVAVLGDLCLALSVGPALLAAAFAWDRVREALELTGGSPTGIVVVALSVAIWLGAVALAGIGAALRAALFTLEGARRA